MPKTKIEVSLLQKSKDDYEGQIRDQQQYIADLRSGEKSLALWFSLYKIHDLYDVTPLSSVQRCNACVKWEKHDEFSCGFLDLKHQYDSQVKELVGSHQRELTQLRDDHKVELNRMQKVLDVVSTLSSCNTQF